MVLLPPPSLLDADEDDVLAGLNAGETFLVAAGDGSHEVTLGDLAGKTFYIRLSRNREMLVWRGQTGLAYERV